VDLDDTILQTKRKIADGDGEHLVLASFARNGNHSYMTRRQVSFVKWLLDSGDVIPVTARGIEAFRAVTIPFRSRAILSNGAVVLNSDGSFDLEWKAIMAVELAPYASVLSDHIRLGNEIAALLHIDVRSWLVASDDVPAYVVFKENQSSEGLGLRRLAEAFTIPAGWTRHLNGNNFAIIPPPVSKARATDYLINHARKEDAHKPVIGFGDSVSDLPFLKLCDWWGTPPGSQISMALSSESVDSLFGVS